MIGAVVLAALVLGGGDPSIHPWPIGPGPRYRPPAQKLDGRPLGTLDCKAGRATFPVHVEVFVNRRVVLIPKGIGRTPSCDYPIRTRSPIGVVDVARGTRPTVADLFRVWGQRFGLHRIASFRAKTTVRAYVGGKLVEGDAGRVRLTPRAEIVLELGPYLAPHRTFLFPPELP